MTRLTLRTDGNSKKVIERFAPAGGRILGVITILIGVLIVGDIIVEWRTWAGLSAAAVVVAVCALVWVGLVRPAVVAYEEALVLRNILSDVRIPWHLVESATVSPVLTLPVGGKVYRSSAVGVTGADRRAMRRSRRESVEAVMRGRSPGSEEEGPAPKGAASLAGMPPSVYTTHRIETLAEKYADASRVTTEVERHWRWPEFAVVVVAILVAVLANSLA
ncbi:hypothetical protein [Actinopolymorpha pittospori]